MCRQCIIFLKTFRGSTEHPLDPPRDVSLNSHYSLPSIWGSHFHPFLTPPDSYFPLFPHLTALLDSCSGGPGSVLHGILVDSAVVVNYLQGYDSQAGIRGVMFPKLTNTPTYNPSNIFACARLV